VAMPYTRASCSNFRLHNSFSVTICQMPILMLMLMRVLQGELRGMYTCAFYFRICLRLVCHSVSRLPVLRALFSNSIAAKLSEGQQVGVA
jgi:hypothetical protein